MTSNDLPDTILIVGADRAERAFLGDNLTADGYEVLEAGALSSARALLSQRRIDLVVVDRGLPDGSGLDLLRVVREADRVAAPIDSDLPVILIADGASQLERIRAFERGCDEYLCGTDLSYAELRARIGALLRRRRRDRHAHARFPRLAAAAQALGERYRLRRERLGSRLSPGRCPGGRRAGGPATARRLTAARPTPSGGRPARASHFPPPPAAWLRRRSHQPEWSGDCATGARWRWEPRTAA